MIPCYVSGKGMYASEVTWSFKTTILEILDKSQLGYDTRFQYYRKQYPDMLTEQLARMICDPVEYYDKDWEQYRATHQRSMSKAEMITRFMLERDNEFRSNAQVAIYCFDEAGFGSGVNVMRFLYERKPILGFLNQNTQHKSLNISNVLQLKAQFPDLIHLIDNYSLDSISDHITRWLNEYSRHQHKRMHLVTE